MISRAVQKLERQFQDELMEAYELFDTRGKGYIDPSALIEGMKSLGYEIDKKQVLAMVDFLDEDKKGSISKEAFKRFMTSRMHINDDPEELKSAYEFFDQNGREKVTLEDLKRVAEELGEDLDECEMILEEADKDGDGMISYEEFMRVIKKTSN